MTTTYPQVVKAGHLHKIQTDDVVVVRGILKLVLYDPRAGSPTKGKLNGFFIGGHNPLVVQIPPEVYHGWMSISEQEAIAVNCPTEAYNRERPNEYRFPPHENAIPYTWQRKDG